MQFINNNTYYIFILILTICIVKIVKLEKLKYDPNKDNVEVLDYKTIGKTIFNSNKATVLQFFSNWCVSCKKFAKYYVEISKETKKWHRNILRIAVIDCAIENNNRICNDHGVQFVPTFKFFSALSFNKGQEFGGEKLSVEEFIKNIIWFLENHIDKPKNWPELAPLRTSIDELVYENRVKYFILIFEEENSLLGRKLILDFSRYLDKFHIRRVTKETNPTLYHRFRVNVNSLPAFYMVENSPEKGIRTFPLEQVLSNLRTDREYNYVDDSYDYGSKTDLRFAYTESINKFIRHTPFIYHVDFEL